MRIVVIEGESKNLLSIEHQTEQTTIREILDAAHVDLRNWNSVWIDNIQTALDTPLRDVALLEGSTISAHPPLKLPTTQWRALITGGLSAGHTHPIPPNSVTRIGRSPEADICLESPSVSWSHCTIQMVGNTLRVIDTNSSNGTFLNGKRLTDDNGQIITEPTQLSLGGVTLFLTHQENDARVPRPESSRALTVTSTIPFNRPPRIAGPHTPSPVELPIKKEPQKANKFSWIAVIAPLLMAGVMVAVMGSIRFALIALLSPVLAVGSWWEQKRRARASEKEENERFSNELNALRSKIHEAENLQRIYLHHQAPDVAISYTRARLGSTKIWQRRPSAEDFLLTRLGDGKLPFTVPTDASQKNAHKAPEVKELLDLSYIPAAPISVDLSEGPIGLWGQRTDCLAVARSLLNQIATHVGPSDLSIGVFTDTPRGHDWKWVSWLPHLYRLTRESSYYQLGLNSENSTQILRNLRDIYLSSPAQSLLLVIDGPKLLEGRDCPARDLLKRSTLTENSSYNQPSSIVTGIIIADSLEKLPAACTSVVHVQHDANLTLSYPSKGENLTDIIGNGIDLETAENWARMLARFEDPELKNRDAELPSLSHLLPLLELEDPSAETLLQSWRKNNDFTTPIGVAEGGIYTLNLLKDGPHGLVGGTTGSGKSEFLRSLVAGLASRVDPEHLNFILIDFKGGAAFASCDQLPHTIGTVSNLDEHLAKRAIQALQAEMKYRQHKFAEAGENIDNLNAYLKTNPPEPMPRILVVIDEFKELASTYPDVLSSLVSVAAVGRTLGIHMILATQRPDGVVNDDILANTNMRVALRVQDRSDSTNVIGVPDASSIGRNQQGRAYIKLGENDITPIQTALITGHCNDSDSTALSVISTELGTVVSHEPARRKHQDTNDLDRLLAAINEANTQAGYAPPRPVWPEPLGEDVRLLLQAASAHQKHDGVVPAGKHPLLVALSDAPEKQLQYASGWAFRESNLLLFGVPGSGTTTALASLAYSAASSYAPHECDILLLDLGTRDLEPLAQLPHTASYIPAGAQNRELHERFMKFLYSTFSSRMQQAGPHTPMFVFIDGLNTLRDDFRDGPSGGLLEGFYQVWEKGPDVGIYCAASSSRLKAAPSQIVDITKQKWFFHLSERSDYSFAGLRQEDIPQPVPGRFVSIESRHHGQIAVTGVEHSEAVAMLKSRYPGSLPKKALIAALPVRIGPASLSAVRTDLYSHPRRIPIGLSNEDLSPAFLDAYEGEHILIAGPARSGKSSVLLAMAEKIRQDADESGVEVNLFAVCSARSPLRNSAHMNHVASFDDAAHLFIEAELCTRPTVLFIDDAEQFDDTSQSLANLSIAKNPHLLIVASSRNDTLRQSYGHWLRKMAARYRLGLLLVPSPDYDGELLGVTLPRGRGQAMPVGRGYLCSNGFSTMIQAVTYVNP